MTAAPNTKTFTLPTITKPPIFEGKQQLINFFMQENIAKLRPLGKIVGIAAKAPKPKAEQEDNEPKGPNEFWNMVNYKDDGNDVSTFLLPDYEPASQVMK